MKNNGHYTTLEERYLLIYDLGVEFYVVEQLLGHALPGVAGVYNRSKFMAKKLDALELWTTYLNSIAGADSKVTILKQKAG